MTMANTMREYLNKNQVDYEEVTHPRAASGSRIAEASHLPGEQVAKAVLIKGDTGYRVMVVPSHRKVDLGGVSHQFRERLGLATEQEVCEIFSDCDPGAIPALGQAYGVRVCYDDTLATQPDLYLEAGDHETLVHIDGQAFCRLMADADHGAFSSDGR